MHRFAWLVALGVAVGWTSEGSAGDGHATTGRASPPREQHLVTGGTLFADNVHSVECA